MALCKPQRNCRLYDSSRQAKDRVPMILQELCHHEHTHRHEENKLTIPKLRTAQIVEMGRFIQAHEQVEKNIAQRNNFQLRQLALRQLFKNMLWKCHLLSKPEQYEHDKQEYERLSQQYSKVWQYNPIEGDISRFYTPAMGMQGFGSIVNLARRIDFTQEEFEKYVLVLDGA